MKIEGNNNQLPEVRETYLRQAADKAHADKTVQPGDDSVRISDRAKEVQKIAAEIQKLPDVREDKVREMKQLISSGNYSVSGEDVAEKMIKEMMLGSIL